MRPPNQVIIQKEVRGARHWHAGTRLEVTNTVESIHPILAPLFGQLLIDSVRRFKGQAALAVVLTECDLAQLTPLNRRLLFVGLTRARVHLEWVVSAATAELLKQALCLN